MNDRESIQWQEGENSPGGAPRKRNRKAWEPDGDDHLVYRWVKFEGKKQAWVASQLGIHQATVSRIVARRAAEQAEQEVQARQQQQLMAEALERVSELEAEAREGAEAGDSHTIEEHEGSVSRADEPLNLHNVHTENELF